MASSVELDPWAVVHGRCCGWRRSWRPDLPWPRGRKRRWAAVDGRLGFYEKELRPIEGERRVDRGCALAAKREMEDLWDSWKKKKEMGGAGTAELLGEGDGERRRGRRTGPAAEKKKEMGAPAGMGRRRRLSGCGGCSGLLQWEGLCVVGWKRRRKWGNGVDGEAAED